MPRDDHAVVAAILVGAQFILQPDIETTENGIRFHFLAPNPGGGENSDYYLFYTNAEFDALTNQNQVDTSFTVRLARMIRQTDVRTKMQGLIGKAYTP